MENEHEKNENQRLQEIDPVTIEQDKIILTTFETIWRNFISVSIRTYELFMALSEDRSWNDAETYDPKDVRQPSRAGRPRPGSGRHPPNLSPERARGRQRRSLSVTECAGCAEPRGTGLDGRICPGRRARHPDRH